jgi:hypothetical protein
MDPTPDPQGLTWAELEAAAPALAADGRALLHRGDGDGGLLATIRGDGLPRINAVSVAIVEGRLLVFVLASAKRTDLEIDGRFALHAHQDAAAPSEFSVRGRARRVEESMLREAAARVWPFEVDDSYWLFELRIEAAVIGRRPTADDWPPVYETWPPRHMLPEGRPG